MTLKTDTAPDVRMHWGVKIPMRDGATLSAVLYMPASVTTARPVIMTMTPYIAQTFHDAALSFIESGYPFIAVDVRGRANSDGHFHPRNEAKDGFDIVEWVSQQSFCNGKVAMWG